MAVTIKDIAKIVGVSPTAVSRALNDHRDIGEETREKIKRVAQELGYRRNAIARGLVTKKTDTIGLFVLGRGPTGFGDPFAYEVILGVMDTVSAAGYDLVLYGVGGPSEGGRPNGRSCVRSYVGKCKERQVDAVIMMGLRTDDPQYRSLSELDVPCVLIDVAPPGDGIGFVASDNVLGSKTATEHLISLGHRKIGMLNGHAHATVSGERLEGYKIALMNAGIPYDPALTFEGDFSSECGAQAAEYFMMLPRDTRPTAVVAASDLMAIGLVQTLKAMGLSIPQDVSVVGFDDIPSASHVDPPLTTVRQARYDLGATAARMVLGRLQDGRSGNAFPAPGFRLATNLIVRGSTAPPRSERA
ncbi:MAG: LacI family transcriptional regulator [Firmicutes bacterium]|jgi:DNA-binding LacI/PurR family transcriptional regulator|nr:LacI family transcriptional regulator [Bacillota bacterium]MDH7495196.1 LacI family DNA-binding transcriptional regulator [Bacillota bacterium]